MGTASEKTGRKRQLKKEERYCSQKQFPISKQNAKERHLKKVVRSSNTIIKNYIISTGSSVTLGI